MKQILRPCIIVGIPDTGNAATIKYFKIQEDLTPGSFKPVTIWEGDKKYLGLLFIDNDATKTTLMGLETILETQLDSWYLDEARNAFKGPLRAFMGALTSVKDSGGHVVATIATSQDLFYVVSKSSGNTDTSYIAANDGWPLFM